MCDIIKRNREEAAAEAAKEERQKNTLLNLKNLMKNTKWSAKQAMDALGISEKEQSLYITALE